MYVPDEPRFRPSALGGLPGRRPAWLTDGEWLPPGSRELYADARTGLFAALRTAGDDDTVLLPAYAPQGLLAPFRARDVAIEYYPVGDDLSLPMERVTERITEIEPDVFVSVDYFGFPDRRLTEIQDCARSVGATLVADCARGLFARDERGRPLGATADVAVYSLHKTLPVPNGGLLVDGDRDPPRPTSTVSEGRDLAVSAAIEVARRVGVRPTLSRSPPRLEPAASRDESLDADEPDGLEAPGWLTRTGLAGCDPASIARTRRKRYRSVRWVFLDADGIDVLTPPVHADACPFGVAVRTADRASRTRLYRLLYRAGLPTAVLQWPFRSGPVPPFDVSRLQNTLLVVPTHQQLPLEAIERFRSVVARF